MTADRALARWTFSLGARFISRLTGEAVQSAFHFLLNIVLILTLTPYEYGSFSIIFMMGAIAVLFSDAFSAIPAMVHIPGRCGPAARAIDVMLGSVALVVCTALSITVAIGTWMWLRGLTVSCLAGAFAGLWALRNYTRAVVLAKPGSDGAIRATLCDMSYAASGTVLLMAPPLLLRIPLTLDGVFAGLSIASATGTLLCLLKQGQRIRVSLRGRTLIRYGRQLHGISWSLVGLGTALIQGQCQMLLVAAIAGPAAFAPIAAGFVLISPIRVFAGSMLNVLLPELSRKSSLGEPQSVRKILMLSISCLLLLALAYGLCLLLPWPFLRDKLYSKNFAAEPMALIVGMAWLTAMTYTAYQPFRALAQSQSRFRDIAMASLGGGVAGLLLVWLLLLSFKPAISTAGVFAGEAVTLFLLWRFNVRSSIRGSKLQQQATAQSIAGSGTGHSCSPQRISGRWGP